MKCINRLSMSLTLAALLAGAPIASQAVQSSESKFTDTATAEFTFASLSNVTVGYSWSDLVYGKNQNSRTVDGLLSYTLDGGSSVSVSSVGNPGASTLSFLDLAAGAHRLVLSGSWNVPAGGTVSTYGHVSLATPSVVAIAPAVPEPESYAMLLAGLGLMGTIARRRNKSKAV